MRLRSGVASSVGLVRHVNEDSYLVHNGLYVVCDGMGGARAGEVASEMACRALSAVDPVSSGPAELTEAVKEANRAIVERSMDEARLRGMGTTLTAAMVRDESLILAHVGDSRAYLFHAGKLTQLTEDHSWVAEMMRRGELTPLEAAIHPHRSIITKALGTEAELEPDVITVSFGRGDRVILCSDGLTGMVSDADIARIVGREEEPEITASLLVQAALAGGGEDNVTVVVVKGVADPEGLEPDEHLPPEPIFGPADRGLPATEKGVISALKGRHPAAAVRERLGGKRPSSDGARRWSRRRWIVLAVVVVLVIVIAIAAFSVVNSAIYYVGTSDGVVALFRGLPGSILGLSLSHVIEQGSIGYDSLAPYLKSRIDAHDLVTKEEGQTFLRSLSMVP
ncbi:MAG: Stp1/IreP family PP2C-type Ser/Thr phosphatase [Actinobacteria bacterium]|nr:Stp1/IreP family PP2C-type Ser/Thr phosphatase [Actinomycetota bacterium]